MSHGKKFKFTVPSFEFGKRMHNKRGYDVSGGKEVVEKCGVVDVLQQDTTKSKSNNSDEDVNLHDDYNTNNFDNDYHGDGNFDNNDYHDDGDYLSKNQEDDEDFDNDYHNYYLMVGGGGGTTTNEDDEEEVITSNDSEVLSESLDGDNDDDAVEQQPLSSDAVPDEVSIMISKIIADFVQKRVVAIERGNTKNQFEFPLFEGSCKSTKDLAEIVRNICSSNNIGLKGEGDILSGIAECFKDCPNLKLPCSVNSKGKVISTIDKVLDSSSIDGIMEFDMCINGCTVYVGDSEDDVACQHCNIGRYYDCNKCAKDDICNHSKTSRRKLSYRCIIPIMVSFGMELAFRQCLNCKTYNYINSDDVKHIADISHASEYQNALLSMENEFKNHIARGNQFINHSADDCVEKLTIDDSTIHIPLLFSVFYDGIQLYKSKVKSFSPLLLTIVNLPPTLRKMMNFGKKLTLKYMDIFNIFIIIYAAII